MGIESRPYDALVIGDGLAGVTAALTAKGRGHSTAVLSMGPGATALSSGAWDFGPVTQDLSFEASWDSESWRRARKAALCSGDALTLDGARAAVEEMRVALADFCPLSARFDHPYYLPVSDGRWRRAYVAQAMHAEGDLRALLGKKVVVPHCRQWRWAGEEIAKAWAARAAETGVTLNLTAKALPDLWRGPDMPLSHVAVSLEADATLHGGFLEAMVRLVKESGAEALLLPPLCFAPSLVMEITEATGVTVAESLSAGEPVAGRRLHEALGRALDKAAIPRLTVLGLEVGTASGSVAAVHARVDAASVEVIRGKTVVLASGKLIGGGIALGYEEVRETVLELPVFVDAGHGPIVRRAEIPWPDRGWREAQPWARLGLRVDASWRPVGSDGRPVLQNVRACGSLLGGVDLARESVGLGFCALTGRECGLSVP